MSRALAATVVAVSFACTTEPTVLPDLSGSYELVSIGGTTLPASPGGSLCEPSSACVLDGGMVLEADGRYTWRFDYTSPEGTDPFQMDGHFTNEGRWDASDGGRLTLLEDDLTRQEALWGSDRLLIPLPATWMFRRD